MLWDFFLPQIVAGNYFLPLDGSANPKISMAKEDREDFFPQSLKGVTIGGHIYGMPESLDTGMFYYRKDLYAQAGLTQPPRTWDELVEMLRNSRSQTSGATPLSPPPITLGP